MTGREPFMGAYAKTQRIWEREYELFRKSRLPLIILCNKVGRGKAREPAWGRLR